MRSLEGIISDNNRAVARALRDRFAKRSAEAARRGDHAKAEVYARLAKEAPRLVSSAVPQDWLE